MSDGHIEVTLVSNDGDGQPVVVPCIPGTTLEKFLEISFSGDPEDFKIRVRTNGTTIDADEEHVLQDGDRVSIAPKKIDGAVML